MSDRDEFEEVILAYEEAVDVGQAPDPQAVIARHPDLAGALKAYFEAKASLDPILAPLREACVHLLSSPTVTQDPSGCAPPHQPGGQPGVGLTTEQLQARMIDYEILGELGRGGMGIVYHARHRTSGEVVALKTLQHASPDLLSRFREEFDALAGIRHRNLVSLYKGFFDAEPWCFTMELVEGTPFDKYVRAQVGPGQPPERDRLEEALCQLCAGVQALHDAGRIHRDIKPSNALVTREGRVVLLDCGLAAQLGPHGEYHSTVQHVVGTVPYMSPEQAAEQPVTVASDWGSVGVVLYQALTGELPFTGAFLDVLRAKQEREPPAPRTRVPEVPADLDGLCQGLLRREPGDRQPAIARLVKSKPPPTQRFVGMAHPLRELDKAFAGVEGGSTVTVRVHGPSGSGKSTLVEHFLERLRAQPDVVILAGRCYEQMSVPYKAIDCLIPALVRHLRRLGPRASGVLPRDLDPLVRLFPILERAPAVEELRARLRQQTDTTDRQLLRARAIAALREMLARLGDQYRLVLYIDDLQWGDEDSARLLGELLRPPDAPVLLLIGSMRNESAETSQLLRTIGQALDQIGSELDRRQLKVEPLSHREAQELAAALLESEGMSSSARAEEIARDSRGHPFFIHELARHAPEGNVTLEEALWARVQGLPENARHLLEVVAISAQPVRQDVAVQAAGMEGDERSVVEQLQAENLVTRGASSGVGELVTYHDRIREVVVSRLRPEQRVAHHERLARELQHGRVDDPEVLAIHWEGAGKPELAARHYEKAADRATEGLAFDRATRLYRLALQRGRWEPGEQASLQTRLGEALANAGRAAEAANAYLQAGSGLYGREARELRRKAGEQYLRAGHIDEGIEVLRGVFQEVGLAFPRTLRRTLWALWWRRVWLRLRGLSYRERPEAEVSAEELERIDLCHSAGLGLSMTNPAYAALFWAQHLLLALRAGESSRVAVGLAWELIYGSTGGGKGLLSAEHLFQKVVSYSEQLGQPYLLAMANSSAGCRAYLGNRWKEAQESFCRAREIYERCTGTAWELGVMDILSLTALAELGEWKELAQRLPPLLREAQERGDRFKETFLLTQLAVVDLAADDPDRAERNLDLALSKWSQRGDHMLHYRIYMNRLLVALYRGEDARALVEENQGLLARTGQHWMRRARLVSQVLLARWALHTSARSGTPGESRSLLRLAERTARKLERGGLATIAIQARVIRAGVAYQRGQIEPALAHLAAAEQGFRSESKALDAAVAQRRRGQLLGDVEGSKLVEEADAWMRGQDIRNPARITAMLVPGFPDCPAHRE